MFNLIALPIPSRCSPRWHRLGRPAFVSPHAVQGFNARHIVFPASVADLAGDRRKRSPVSFPMHPLRGTSASLDGGTDTSARLPVTHDNVKTVSTSEMNHVEAING